MPDRTRRRPSTRLALVLGAAAVLGLTAVSSASGFEPGGRHGGGGLGGGAAAGLGGPQGLGGGVGMGMGMGGPTGLGGLGRGAGGPHSMSPADGLTRQADDALNGPGNGRGGGLLDRGDKAARGRKGENSGKGVGRTVEDAVTAAADPVVSQSRQSLVRQLLRDHPDALEPDALGQPVVRGEVLALAPTPAAVAQARQAGFTLGASEFLPELGLRMLVLTAPHGMSAAEALRRMHALDPQGQYDLDHVYQQGGVVGAAQVRSRTAASPQPATAVDPSPQRGLRVGLVDGGVPSGIPALGGARLVQQGFARGGPTPSAHAVAVASLLAGRLPPFRGAAPGATLYVADVYGSTAAGGSAEAIARALAWLARAQVPVINISLVGPPNLLLASAVKALVARGHLVVAAVGNDGPAAPPLYPASYPGVVAVTGVDARRHLLPEAGRATHVDFAAPGSDMAAAGLDGGFVSVRGTSFAAPLAAGLLARLESQPSPAAASRAMQALTREAVDAGTPGHDSLFGHGLVGLDLRTAPAAVHARMALRGP